MAAEAGDPGLAISAWFMLDLGEFAALAADVERSERAVAMLAPVASITGCALYTGILKLSRAVRFGAYGPNRIRCCN